MAHWDGLPVRHGLSRWPPGGHRTGSPVHRVGLPVRSSLRCGRGKVLGARCAHIMATMSMMKKALHMGRSDAERAARIFLDDSRRPKRRTTRRARRMLMGKSRGPRTTRDIVTTKASKTDQPLVANSRNQLQKRLSRSSKVKTIVKAKLAASSVCLMKVVVPSA